jgi:hypothetical protein
MKKETYEKFLARIITKGFLQEKDIHFCGNHTATLATNKVTIKSLFVLLTLADWDGNVIDFKGALLKGRFKGR